MTAFEQVYKRMAKAGFVFAMLRSTADTSITAYGRTLPCPEGTIVPGYISPGGDVIWGSEPPEGAECQPVPKEFAVMLGVPADRRHELN